MKAQLTFQYLISFIAFIGLIIYIYISYSANIPAYIQTVKKEATRSKAYQLSELLINDPGEPVDWYQLSADNIKRIGLSDESLNRQNLISSKKIDKLNNNFICSTEASYNLLRKKLGLEDKDFSIIISMIENDGSRNPLYDCIPSITAERTIKITRIVTINDTNSVPSGVLNATEVIVQM